ncbi:DUF4276 family protein [Acinetobacter baumannii]
MYGLDTSFPNYDETRNQTDVYQRVNSLEQALHQALINFVECRPDRIIPYIQPYEFEGLLFSDITQLCLIEPTWQRSQDILQRMRDEVDSPEHINNGFQTKPSKDWKIIYNLNIKRLHMVQGLLNILARKNGVGMCSF